MGKQTSIVRYTGRVGNTVGYYHKGKLCMRSLPEHVNISEATKLSATDFGTASKAGKLVRYALKPELGIHHDSDLTNRLNTSLLKVLYAGSQQRGARSIQRKHLNMLAGFKLNEDTELGKLLPLKPAVAQNVNSLRIAIPAIEKGSIRHAKNTTHIELKAIAVGVNFSEGDYEQAVSAKVMIDIRQPAEATELVLPFKAGEAETIVVFQVKAFSEEGGRLYALGNRKYFAADIIDIIPSLPEEIILPTYNIEREQKPVFMWKDTLVVPQME
ncbi:hypothetical protein [Chitinophaga niabensis]|uniref:Uncharacterized protein n=1 Tax=Chitinophaga niabensis TaxID=536979 RepID=A0A1N6EQ08_9BACT|nr:hypothetical protein [Chitinophaga niabensis]SIN85031.1 hypothetical protein SAMN04488055_1752 [Chitinophaga niabensis]